MPDDPFISYAQNFEDVMLWRALGGVGPGFYIDAGAADPDRLSVTRAFYERGWHGLNIEPLPEQAERLRQARPRDIVVQAALSDTPGEAAFYRVRHDGDLGLSTLDAAAAAGFGHPLDPLPVPVTTLAALCREHVTGPVHFLKVDVEGAERAVLAGADFAAVRPWIVLVEATKPLTQHATELEWDSLLVAAGYVFVWFDALNRFYVAQEHHAALARHFQVPPNVFDAFLKSDPNAAARITAAEQLAAERLTWIGTLELEVARLEAEAKAAAASPEPAPPEPEPAPLPPVPAPAPVPLPVLGRRSKLRSLALAAYGLVRPVVKPIAWRSRGFITGEVMAELADMRARQYEIMGRLDVIREVAEPKPVAPDQGLGRTAERLLLTLALESRGR